MSLHNQHTTDAVPHAAELLFDNTAILRNILHSIGVAVLLLDPQLKIIFFTPEIEPFFHLIASDIGRPLGDLNYLAADLLLTEDCETVLQDRQPLGREIAMAGGKQFTRRLAPYFSEVGKLDGLVLAFNESTAIGNGSGASTNNPDRNEYSESYPFPRLPAQNTVAANPRRETAHELIRLIGQTASTLSFMLNNLRERRPGPSRTDAEDAVADKVQELRGDASRRIENLTQRERQIMKMVVSGHASKIIAAELGISERTVENHRAAIMRKTESKSLPALARVAFASGLSSIGEPEVNL